MRVLVTELWGLGDAVLATGVIARLQDEGHEVGVICKPVTRSLLSTTFGDNLKWHEINAPWTAHRGKYRLWSWDWKKIVSIVRELRRARYDASLSIREDPRDDLVCMLGGVKKRRGFRRWSWWWGINDTVALPSDPHRLMRWQRVLDGFTNDSSDPEPLLESRGKRKENVIMLHVGASVAVRRWGEDKWKSVIIELRDYTSSYRIELILDPDGFGEELIELVDDVHRELSLDGLQKLLGTSTLVMGNDSGPCHIAAAMGTPTVVVFGPQLPEVFKPWGNHVIAIDGEECEHKPCSDYCAFSEPHCLTQMDTTKVSAAVKKLLDI